MPEKLDPLVWTVGEVAQMLGVSNSTVSTMARTGELPSIRMGVKRVLIPKVALAEYMGVTQATKSPRPPVAAAVARVADLTAQLAAAVADLAQLIGDVE